MTDQAAKTIVGAIAGERGEYSFPSLPVGGYHLEIQAPGSRPMKRTGIRIDADNALKEDPSGGYGRGKCYAGALCNSDWRLLTPSTTPSSLAPGPLTGISISPLFGQVVRAAPPRLVQVALKLPFDMLSKNR